MYYVKILVYLSATGVLVGTKAIAGVTAAAGALAELGGELPLSPGAGRRSSRADLRLDVLTDTTEPTDVATQQRERDRVQILRVRGWVALRYC